MFVLLLMALNAIVLEVIVAQDLESPSPYSTSNPFPTPYLVQHERKQTSSDFNPTFIKKKEQGKEVNKSQKYPITDNKKGQDNFKLLIEHMKLINLADFIHNQFHGKSAKKNIGEKNQLREKDSTQDEVQTMNDYINFVEQKLGKRNKNSDISVEEIVGGPVPLEDSAKEKDKTMSEDKNFGKQELGKKNKNPDISNYSTQEKKYSIVQGHVPLEDFDDKNFGEPKFGKKDKNKSDKSDYSTHENVKTMNDDINFVEQVLGRKNKNADISVNEIVADQVPLNDSAKEMSDDINFGEQELGKKNQNADISVEEIVAGQVQIQLEDTNKEKLIEYNNSASNSEEIQFKDRTDQGIFYVVFWLKLIFLIVILTTGGFVPHAKKVKGALPNVLVRHRNGSFMCTLPDLPIGRFGHTQSGLEACGGSQPKNCVMYNKGLSTILKIRKKVHIHLSPKHHLHTFNKSTQIRSYFIQIQNRWTTTI